MMIKIRSDKDSPKYSDSAIYSTTILPNDAVTKQDRLC